MTPPAKKPYCSRTRLLRAILTPDPGSAEKIGLKRGIEKLFWPNNKIRRCDASRLPTLFVQLSRRFLFFCRKYFSIPLFRPIFSAGPESGVRMALRSLVFEQYGFFAGGVIFPDHRQSIFVQKLPKLCSTTPPPVVIINMFQIPNVLNFNVSPNFAKN